MAISPIGAYSVGMSYNPYAYSGKVSDGLYPAGRSDLSPVQPVDRADAVTRGRTAAAAETGIRPAQPQLPEVRQGADPVEMSVRSRIHYLSGEELDNLTRAAQSVGTQPAGTAQATDAAAEETKSAAEVMEEGECQTCANRTYQDGSDDPGVSFKTPAHIDPSVAASVVRGHEQEHVTREQAKAEREGREVVSQSVTLHSDICPECGKVYVSGGTTRTTTQAENEPQQERQQEQGQDAFAAVA